MKITRRQTTGPVANIKANNTRVYQSHGGITLYTSAFGDVRGPLSSFGISIVTFSRTRLYTVCGTQGDRLSSILFAPSSVKFFQITVVPGNECVGFVGG